MTKEKINKEEKEKDTIIKTLVVIGIVLALGVFVQNVWELVHITSL